MDFLSNFFEVFNLGDYLTSLVALSTIKMLFMVAAVYAILVFVIAFAGYFFLDNTPMSTIVKLIANKVAGIAILVIFFVLTLVNYYVKTKYGSWGGWFDQNTSLHPLKYLLDLFKIT